MPCGYTRRVIHRADDTNLGNLTLRLHTTRFLFSLSLLCFHVAQKYPLYAHYSPLILRIRHYCSPSNGPLNELCTQPGLGPADGRRHPTQCTRRCTARRSESLLQISREAKAFGKHIYWRRQWGFAGCNQGRNWQPGILAKPPHWRICGRQQAEPVQVEQLQLAERA